MGEYEDSYRRAITTVNVNLDPGATTAAYQAHALVSA
jgi:hypothetical protein